MRTNKITSFNLSLGQIFKIGLGAGFGLFGGAQLISGYWALGMVSCGLGAVLANDSLAFFKEPINIPSEKPKPTNTNQDNKKSDPISGQTSDLVKKQKAKPEEKNPSPKPVKFLDTKQNNQSESRHKPVPTLNLATANSATIGYTPLAMADSGGATPSSGGISRKKKSQRLSQKPTAREMETVRAMTEEEVDFLASQPSPKQITKKTIPKK